MQMFCGDVNHNVAAEVLSPLAKVEGGIVFYANPPSQAKFDLKMEPFTSFLVTRGKSI